MSNFVEGFFDFSPMGDFEGVFMVGFREYKIEVEICIRNQKNIIPIQILRTLIVPENTTKEDIYNKLLPQLFESSIFNYNIQDSSYEYHSWDTSINQRSLVPSYKDIIKIKVLSITSL